MNLQLFEVLRISTLELIGLVGPLIFIGLILGAIEHKTNNYLFITLGYKGILATAWLGTPIHELGHALMCLIFGHKITGIRLLMINRVDGALGYVSHSYNRRSIYQSVGNFFIGIAPLISGIGTLLLSLFFLLPHSFRVYENYLQTTILSKPFEPAFIKGLAEASFVLSQSLFSGSNLTNPRFWIFLLAAICISSHMALSRADIKGAAQGLLTLFVVLLILTIIGKFTGVNAYGYIAQVSRYNAYILTFSVLALICSLFSLGLSFTVYQLKKAR